jgi:hypothetical protein
MEPTPVIWSSTTDGLPPGQGKQIFPGEGLVLRRHPGARLQGGPNDAVVDRITDTLSAVGPN